MIPTRLPRPIPVSLAASLLLFAAACGGKGQGAGFTPPPMPVEIATARQETVRETFRSLGTVEADESVELTAEIDAIVEALPFDEGRLVAKGDTIARLDDSELSAEVNRARALRDRARVAFTRFEELTTKGIASPDELDAARANLDVAEANLRLAEARLSKTQIQAPFAGVIGRRLVSPGAYLRAGDKITDLSRVDRVKVNFSVPERHLPELRRGSTVDVTTIAYPGKVFQGRVDVVDPVLDPATRSARLVAVIDNPNRDLRPGMSADVQAVLAERPGAVTVPEEAIFAEGDRNYVYAVKPDSTVARVAVELGTRAPGRVEIRAGLSPGQKVVRAGHQKLFDGAKIQPIESAEAPQPAGSPSPAARGGKS